jgi:hypothetical protein
LTSGAQLQYSIIAAESYLGGIQRERELTSLELVHVGCRCPMMSATCRYLRSADQELLRNRLFPMVLNAAGNRSYDSHERSIVVPNYRRVWRRAPLNWNAVY